MKCPAVSNAFPHAGGTGEEEEKEGEGEGGRGGGLIVKKKKRGGTSAIETESPKWLCGNGSLVQGLT